jgi:hypothetical protein
MLLLEFEKEETVKMEERRGKREEGNVKREMGKLGHRVEFAIP